MRAQYFLKVTSDEKGKISINYVSNFELNLKNYWVCRAKLVAAGPIYPENENLNRRYYEGKGMINLWTYGVHCL